jgi:RNA polymerase sigma-70 factor, ECF subfamily
MISAMKISKEHVLDELLILKIQNGDMKAFSILVKRYQPALLNQAYRMTLDDDGALDVAQEAWQAIAKGIVRLKSPAAFRTWAYRIVSNKAVNWINDQKKQRFLRHYNNEVLASKNDIEHTDDLVLIKRALSELPVKNKTVLSMFYVDNHSVKEIAAILNLSPGTVKSRLFYARQMLKEKFEKFNK